VGDADLQALALQDRGRVLVALGRVKEGMALIDEAMTAGTAGELTPRTTGRVYCNMMSTCDRLQDYGRAAEWYDVATGWSEPYPESGYPGICRVHRAGMLRLRGALTEAESEARRAAEELGDFLTDVAGAAFYEIGEVRLRMGDLPAAAAMFAEAHTRGRDPQPGLALLRLAEGKSDSARAMIERAMTELGRTPLDRAPLLPAVVEIRLACGEVNGAAEAAAELEAIAQTYTSPALAASAALALGRIELARGRAEQAMVHLRRACRTWSAIDLPIVLPPSVAGLGLLLVFGRRGLLGESLDAAGLAIPFTTVAVILQTIFNTEVMRYTLATGETALSGFNRFWKHWGLVLAVLVYFANLWPGWAPR